MAAQAYKMCHDAALGDVTACDIGMPAAPPAPRCWTCAGSMHACPFARGVMELQGASASKQASVAADLASEPWDTERAVLPAVRSTLQLRHVLHLQQQVCAFSRAGTQRLRSHLACVKGWSLWPWIVTCVHGKTCMHAGADAVYLALTPWLPCADGGSMIPCVRRVFVSPRIWQERREQVAH